MHFGFRFFSLLLLLFVLFLYYSVPDLESFELLKASRQQYGEHAVQARKESTGLYSVGGFSLTSKWPFFHVDSSWYASGLAGAPVSYTYYYVCSLVRESQHGGSMWIGLGFHWFPLEPWFDGARACVVPFQRCSYHGVLVSDAFFHSASSDADADSGLCLCFPSWTVESDCSLSIRKFDPILFRSIGLLELLVLLSLVCTIYHRLQCRRHDGHDARPSESKGGASLTKWSFGSRLLGSLYASPSIVHLIQVLAGIYQLGPWMIYRLGPCLAMVSWTGVSVLLGLCAWLKQSWARHPRGRQHPVDGVSGQPRSSAFPSTIGPSGSLLMMRTIHTMDLFMPSYGQTYSYWVTLSQWIAAQALIDAAIGPKRRPEWMSYVIAVGAGWALYQYYYSLPLKIF